PVVEARAAAERALSIADRPRRDSSIRHQVRIKGITGNRLASRQSGIDGLRQGTGKGSAYRAARVDCFEDGPGSEVWLAGFLEIKGGSEEFHVVLRGDADGEATLERKDSRYFPAVQELSFEAFVVGNR